ncbi:MAG: hypothetical protein WAZ77_18995 [Candidatus Nitrosopolaris sp.]
MEEERGTKNKKIELSFPKLQSPEDNEYLPKGKGVQGGILERFSASIEEVSDWFKQYQVDTIELWISGVIETGGITRLVVSAKGEGGLRIVLKPSHI